MGMGAMRHCINIIIGGRALQAHGAICRAVGGAGGVDMILGNVNDEEMEGVVFSPAMKRAFRYLKETDFSKVGDGRYEIDGNRIYATVQRYQTKPERECRPESHRRYADVQYVAAGQEFIGWCAFTPALVVAEPYNEEKDITFYEKLEPESYFVLTEGSFAILTPKDIHRPCCAIDEPSPVLKVVVKVAVELLEEEMQ